MPANVTTKGRQSRTGEKVKQLYSLIENLPEKTALLSPFFCAEARIDFNDVRTGFRETVSLSKALEIYSDKADLLWTDDMIWDIDLARTSASAPDGVRLQALPEFVDAAFLSQMENQFSQYLLRSFEVKIYRNFDLNLYSFSGESQSDFCKRCLELFDGPRRQELDRLREVFIRKLEQAKQKYLKPGEGGELEQAKSESRNRDAFFRCLERISEIFSKAESSLRPVFDPPISPAGPQELDERLFSLESEANHAVGQVADFYDSKARAVDEYILHPNLKDIHFVRSCILWMSKEHPGD
jgi:hypothetical protein